MLLSILEKVDKHYFKCGFRIHTIINGTVSDSIFTIIDEGGFRKADGLLKDTAWFIINKDGHI